MNCPGCAAAMRLAGNRGYFHCVHCGHFHFPCETDEGIRPVGEPADGNCPVCRIGLETALIDGETVYYCQKCRGFLTGIARFGAIVTKRRARHGPHEQVTDPFDPAELRRGLMCPCCRIRMQSHPYFGGGNAVVDTCDRCGLIWLDAGELAIIERYIPHVHKIEPARVIVAPVHPFFAAGAAPLLFGASDDDVEDFLSFL